MPGALGGLSLGASLMTRPPDPTSGAFPTDLTAQQIEQMLHLRGIRVGADDLVALSELTRAVRQQALALLHALEGSGGVVISDP